MAPPSDKVNNWVFAYEIKRVDCIRLPISLKQLHQSAYFFTFQRHVAPNMCFVFISSMVLRRHLVKDNNSFSFNENKSWLSWAMLIMTSVQSLWKIDCKTNIILSLPPPRKVMFSSLFVYLFVCPLATLRKNFRTDLRESFREDCQWANKQMFTFRCRSGSPSGYMDCFPDSSLLGDTENGTGINRLRCATLQCMASP